MEEEQRVRIIILLNVITICFSIIFMLSLGLTLDLAEIRKIFGLPAENEEQEDDTTNTNKRCSSNRRCNIVYPARVGLFAQIFFNPIICVLLCLCFVNLDTRFKIAAVLIACAPSGMASNMWVILCYGNTEISVVMTLFTSTAALVTVPFFFWLAQFVLSTSAYQADSNSEGGTIIPFGEIFASVAFVCAPLLLAIGMQRCIKSPRMKNTIRRLGMVLGLCSVGCATAIFYFDTYLINCFVNAGWEPFVLGISLNLAGMLLGYSASRLGKLDVEYHRTIAFEVGTQNLAIPMGVIAVAFLDDPELQAPYKAMIFIYALCSLAVNISLTLVWRYIFPLQHVIDKRRRLLQPEETLSPTQSDIVGGIETDHLEQGPQRDEEAPPTAAATTT